MADIFSLILRISLSSVFSIALIMIIRVLFKRLPKRIFVFLWGLLFIQLLLPSSFSRINKIIPEPVQMGFSDETLTEFINFIYEPVSVDYQNNNDYSQIEIGINTAEYIEQRKSEPNILPVLWLMGTIGFISYFLIASIKLKIQIFNCPKSHIVKNIYVLQGGSSPFTSGIIQPVIYVPDILSQEEYALVIAHEEAHIRWKDYILKPLFFITLSVHWFNPFIWLAYAIMEADMEMACDESTIKLMNLSEKKAYSSSLVKFAESARICTNVLCFGQSPIKRRIQNVLNYKKCSLKYLVLGLTTVLLAACNILYDSSENEISEIVQESEYEIQLTTKMPEGNKPAYFDILVNDETLDDVLALDNSKWKYPQARFEDNPVIFHLAFEDDERRYVFRDTFPLLAEEHFPHFQNINIETLKDNSWITNQNGSTYVQSNNGLQEMLILVPWSDYIESNSYAISEFGYGPEDGFIEDSVVKTKEDGSLYIRFYVVKEDKPVYFSKGFISQDGEYLYINEKMVAASKGFKRVE